ncbi:MAG: hypothetical protein JXA77_00790 [Bacteroidales bacterium]|nr:hypothetical protein [Bacteroidales bacterium]MBN2820795.1 hypothetical protein [Bacteroidales bacterium]
MKTLLTAAFLILNLFSFGQNKDVPVQINLKDGGSIEAVHFGQLKCGTQSSFLNNFVIIRGMFLDNVTEIKDYADIEKLILEGFNADPVNSIGNEKSTIYVQKKNGKTFTLENAEITLSCYGVGDKYNQLIVQIENPITEQRGETVIDVKNIHSIIFK